ncbi:MAG TPA: hypothetical protein QGG47_13850 [Acidobacteriota bacterium]|nr:hypothetical protein [Acidobacteriota bacterium]
MARLVLVASMALAAAAVPSQEVVPVHQEPRHHLVHEGDGFRVLDVQLESGDTTLFHTHDAPITYVSIDASAVDTQPLGGEWGGTDSSATSAWEPGQVTWNLGYATEPLTHRVTTVGPGLFRLMGIINYGSGATDAKAPAPAMVGAIEAESRWFRVSRLLLDPGQRVLWSRSARPVVAVLVTEGRVVASQNGRTTEATARGAFFVQDALFDDIATQDAPPNTAAEYEFRNSGPAPVSLVFVELR